MGSPDFAILDENLTFTVNFTAGSGVPVDADGNVEYSIYEDETGTAIVTGTMAKLDDAGTTGFYSEQIACTQALGYERYKTYTIRITGAVSSVTVAKTYSFICLGGSDAVTATTGALTTTANFKTYIGLTGSGDDTLIAALINRATDIIEKYCQRTLVTPDNEYRERYDGGSNEIILKNYPVNSVRVVSLGIDDVMSVTNTRTAAYRADVSILDIDPTAPSILLKYYPSALGEDIPIANSATLALLAVAVNAASGDWTADVVSGFESYDPIDLLPTGQLGCYNSLALLQMPAKPESDYEIDFDTGIIKLNRYSPRGMRNIIVQYSAGYGESPSRFSAIPAGLEQACIDIVKIMYDARKKDAALKSEKLGDYAYSFKASSELGNLPPYIAKTLDSYRRYDSFAF